ncbi:MAG: hypothetical protein KGY76_08520 [Candidatus Thermoplasmatota archaeon]|nr:hypothetical protein [Candidatus Thermoplasmatota archaeon]
MSEIDDTIKSLEWDRRLKEVRFGVVEEESEESTYRTLDILIAFFVGLLFGVIVAGLAIPSLLGML